MPDKFVFGKDSKLTRDPAGTPADFSGYVVSGTIQLAKKDLDMSGWADKADRHGKGTSGHTVTLTFRPSSTFSAQLQKLIDGFNSDNPTKWEVLMKNAAVGPDNLRFRFDATEIELPIGGNRGDVLEISVTWPIDGHVEVYDGTTTTNL